ncbi:unnamed protein product [Arctogadus glacialis]
MRAGLLYEQNEPMTQPGVQRWVCAASSEQLGPLIWPPSAVLALEALEFDLRRALSRLGLRQVEVPAPLPGTRGILKAVSVRACASRRRTMAACPAHAGRVPITLFFSFEEIFIDITVLLCPLRNRSEERSTRRCCGRGSGSNRRLSARRFLSRARCLGSSPGQASTRLFGEVDDDAALAVGDSSADRGSGTLRAEQSSRSTRR